MLWPAKQKSNIMIYFWILCEKLFIHHYQFTGIYIELYYQGRRQDFKLV